MVSARFQWVGLERWEWSWKFRKGFGNSAASRYIFLYLAANADELAENDHGSCIQRQPGRVRGTPSGDRAMRASSPGPMPPTTSSRRYSSQAISTASAARQPLDDPAPEHSDPPRHMSWGLPAVGLHEAARRVPCPPLTARHKRGDDDRRWRAWRYSRRSHGAAASVNRYGWMSSAIREWVIPWPWSRRRQWPRAPAPRS